MHGIKVLMGQNSIDKHSEETKNAGKKKAAGVILATFVLSGSAARTRTHNNCQNTFGQTYLTANGARANIRLGNRDFLTQQNWVNDRRARCAMFP